MNIRPDDVLIFLGPSLPLDEAKAILPARYFPPARQGDVMSAALQYRPKVVGLIDGFFDQTPSVWHKEILYLLSQQIVVVGASSMGALRAVELEEYGMIGIGRVFALYKSGQTIEDDEVALLHAPEENQYRPLSLPLVNLRFTLDALRQKGLATQEEGLSLFQAARSLYYPDRAWPLIRAAALSSGMQEEKVDSLLRECQAHYVDQKREDARELLTWISKALPIEAKPFHPTSHFEALFHADRRLLDPPISLRASQIAQFAALHHPQFPALSTESLNHELVHLLAKLLHVEPEACEVEEERRRFFLRHQIDSAEKRVAFLAQNDWSEEEFELMLRKKAGARRLQRAHQVGATPWRTIKALLDELKWRGEYEEWKQKALCQEHLLQDVAPYFDDLNAQETSMEELIAKHLQETKWSPDTSYSQWMEEGGFFDEGEFKRALLRASLARTARFQLLDF